MRAYEMRISDWSSGVCASDLEKAPARGYFPFPAVDGKTVPRQLVDSFDRNEQAPVPILAGFNAGEIRSLRFLLPKPPADAVAYEAAIRANYGEFADAFLARYPAKTTEDSMPAATPDAQDGRGTGGERGV